MTGSKYKPKYWGQVAGKMADGQAFDEALAEHYRRIHLDLINRWADVTASRTVLKTDLFAEALCPSRAFLWDILKRNGNVTGIDISAEIAARARANTAQYAAGVPAGYATCDVRQLPFADNSFELIISDSTLDHFRHKSDIATALHELKRVLKPGGTLIITLDNKGNITEPLFRLWILLRLSPFFIGETYSIRELQQALAEAGFVVNDSTAIIHNPRLFTRLIIAMLRKLAPSRSKIWIGRLLDFLDSLESRGTRYLTAQFIASKAVKPSD
jgi:ubiquinone/menaquinone biosynthesis C-methylase UbiE